MGEALKDNKIDEFKTILSSEKTVSIDILRQIESTLKVTED